MEKFELTEIRKRVSWGSVIAGVITVLAISILLSILGSSIGLFMFNPLADNPASGIGTTVGIWTVISLLISLGVGSFVAGKLAGADGLIHGFLVWATSLIITIVLSLCLMVGTVKVTANILGSVSSVLGNTISGTATVVGSGISGLSDQAQMIWGNIQVDPKVENGNIQQNVLEALKKSGVKELQPEYIQNQMNDVKSDLQKSLTNLISNPNDADQIIDGFKSRLKDRAESFSSKIDRNDISKAIANNSSMSKAEVDKTVDQYIQLRDKAVKQAQEQIDNLDKTIADVKQSWDRMKEDALKQVKEASNAAAWTGIISFIALLIGAALCSYAGLYGSRKTRGGAEY